MTYTQSLLHIVSLFHRSFLFLHFPLNLSVGRILVEVRALWMARVSSTPLFLFLRVPFCSPRSTCVSRPARPSPTRWRFPIPIASLVPFVPSDRQACTRKSHPTLKSTAPRNYRERMQ